MNGKVLGVASVLLIFMAACLICVPVLGGPITTGEHPWGSDRTGDVEDTNRETAISYEDSLALANSQDQAVAPPDDEETADSAVTWLQTVAQIASLMTLVY